MMRGLPASILVMGGFLSHLAELSEIELLLDAGKTKKEIAEEGFSENDIDRVIEKRNSNGEN